jgi:hypothetical protein
MDNMELEERSVLVLSANKRHHKSNLKVFNVILYEYTLLRNNQ